MKKILIFGFVFFIFTSSYGQLTQLSVSGKPEKSPDEIVGKRDTNGRFCAAIQVISDMDGFKYQSYNGVVDVDDQPGRDMVYLTPDERVLEIFKSGYEPLKIILSEYGIQLKPKHVWKIKVAGQKTLTKIGAVFITKPEGARISVDGKDYGVVKRISLSTGSHSVRLHKDGFEPMQQTIQLDEKNSLFEYTLKEIEDVLLQITTVPEGATVFIDSLKFGQTPLSDFYPSGKYSLRIEKDWYVTYEDFIEIKAPDNLHTYTLRPDFGSLTVTSAPQSSLDIYINDQNLNLKTPHTFNRLKPGVYRVDGKTRFFETTEKEIEITRGGTHQVHLISENNFAVLNINTIPGAVIYLNDQKITDLTNIRMEPMLARVRAEMLPKGKPVEKRIVLKKNDNVTIEIRPEIATGTIQVAVVPFDASITLRGDAGEYFTSDKSNAFKDIPVGTYNLTVEKDDFITQAEKLELSENETIKRQITLVLAQKYAQNQTDNNNLPLVRGSTGVHPFFKSMFVPGIGQITSGHKRGYFYLASTLAAAGWYYSAYDKHSENMDEYNQVVSVFENNRSANNVQAVNEAFDKTDKAYKKGLTALYVLGGLYAVNILDALFFSSANNTSKSYSVKPSFNTYSTNLSNKLMFGLNINW